MERVTAIVSHYNRPHLIGAAIESLLAQSRPLDAIVVVDDASDWVPLESIPDHPSVSVHQSHANVGPYRLIEWVVRTFPSDWYMMQDSDDISAPSRLERLLDAAHIRGADMVGSAMDNFGGEPCHNRVKVFEEDAVAAHMAGTWWVCAFNASIFKRALWARVGGFATGLRFGADSEFISRACHVGRVINVPSVELRRRVHPDALTQRPDTGMHSPARKALRAQLQAIAEDRRSARTAGQPVDLQPFSTSPDIRVTTVRGIPPS